MVVAGENREKIKRAERRDAEGAEKKNLTTRKDEG
jgi:hypothetical protein